MYIYPDEIFYDRTYNICQRLENVRFMSLVSFAIQEEGLCHSKINYIDIYDIFTDTCFL